MAIPTLILFEKLSDNLALAFLKSSLSELLAGIADGGEIYGFPP
ncbi:MAG: hypothetical protein ACRCXX_13300 [Cetobacterium sp.]